MDDEVPDAIAAKLARRTPDERYRWSLLSGDSNHPWYHGGGSPLKGLKGKAEVMDPLQTQTMNTNEQNARINQLLKRYDEAKTTDAEEAELAEFFRTSTEVPEEWQDYAVLFSTLEAADTLFIDKELDLLPHKNRRNWWWGIGIAASIAIVAGLTFAMIPKYLKSTEPVIVQQTDTIIKEEHPQIVKNLDVPEPLQPDSLIETVTPQAPVLPHIEEEPHEEHIYAGLEMTAVDSALIGRIAGPGIGQPEPSERLMGREEFEKSYGGFGSGIHIGRVTGSAVDGAPWDSTLLQKLRDEGRTEIHPYDTLFGAGMHGEILSWYY